ncbi:glycoside hydrolase family 3 protein, partial [Mariniphaga sediminis]|uniref:glycoside hydrolase family 3 protein n=1 Tax=Mariniphaga sediminis TaxID=1628158 RepID=UPI0035639B53
MISVYKNMILSGNIKACLFRIGFVAFVFCCFPGVTGAQPYKDASLPVEQRVDDLLGRMSLEEKVAQLGMNNFDGYQLGTHGYGACETPFVHVKDIAVRSREIKKFAREETRLSIPPIQSGECLHGVLAYGATIFPQSISQGSTWNPGLIREMAAMIALEASAVGIDQALSPVFDLARDPRFGRMEECYSEDPYLAGEIGCAFVCGMQGDPGQTRYKLEFDKVMCTAKHFAGYSVPVAGLNVAPASIGEREMRSLHLLPFEKAVKKGNIYAVMPSYNEVDGMPAHANKFLLQKVLRDEWKFPGYVFSDYSAIGMMYYLHKTAGSFEDAAFKAIISGVDLDAPRPDSYKFLISLVRDNKLDVAVIDQACRRILTAKFKAGLFEKPFPDPAAVQKRVHVPAHINMSRKVAEESVILLKNEGNLLPLDVKKIKSLAVIGPNADQVQYGD